MGFEETGLEILKKLGFENIRRPLHQVTYMHYDFDAERDGIKYSIEVKTTREEHGRFTIPVDELRDMAQRLFPYERRALILFVDESQTPVNYFLFKMERVSFGWIPMNYDGEGNILSEREKKGG